MKYGDDLTLVMAFDKNGLIGRNNKLPWNIKEDLDYFRKTTISANMNSIIVMGFNTLVSLNGRTLPDRSNVVITKDHKKVEDLGYNVSLDPKDLVEGFDGVVVFNSIEDFLDLKNEDGCDVFIIGGIQIVEYCIRKKLIKRGILTVINKDFGIKPFDLFFGAENIKYFNGKRRLISSIVSSEGIELNVYNIKARV